MINSVMFQFFIVHIMACAWFLIATFEENIFETWVGKKGIVDSTSLHQYIQSLYWSIQTVTTVGYGDFALTSSTEYIIAIIWITVGCNIYAFAISNVSTMVANLD